MKQTGRFTICMLTAWMMLCMLVFPNAGTMMTKVNAAETSISLEVTYPSVEEFMYYYSKREGKNEHERYS